MQKWGNRETLKIEKVGNAEMETLGNREALKIKKLKNWEIGKLRNPVVRKSDPPTRCATPA